MSGRPRVLFLCTGNSCRSQMAEGWARHFHGASLDACSAGVETHGLNPLAVRVMKEAGVDISAQRSQPVDEFVEMDVDLVVTVCDHAAERCPVFPGAPRTIHRAFADPAKATGDEDEVLDAFRRVRDEVRDWVRGLPALLAGGAPMTVGPWERVGEETLSEHRIFRLRAFRARSPRTGDARRFTVLDTPDWVNVVALTGEGKLVLVRQYRHAVDRVTLEIPGGMIDPGEDPATAAARELREETGWVGAEPILLGVVEPNPAILTNRCFTYLVRDCARVAETNQDPGEHIETVTLPESAVRAAVADGSITHALVLCALGWYWSVAGEALPPQSEASDVAGA